MPANEVRIGFGKADITPRVGVQLMGYGPYLNRHSIAVRDRLYARALAASDGETTVVLASCDIVGIGFDLVARIRERVRAETGLGDDGICIHSTHTHSGPNGGFGIGWGEPDPPYLEVMPERVAQACVQAVADLQPATMSHAVVPCEGIGYDREEDKRPPMAEALADGWRPARTDTIDTAAQVLRFDGADGLLGFISYYSCHPVIGSETSRYIHGDYAGVATNWLERQHPGSVGMFLQGCHGNINTCVVHENEQDSLLALDVLAARYARQVAPGIAAAKPIAAAPVRGLRAFPRLARRQLPRETVQAMLDEHLAKAHRPDAADSERDIRMGMVYAAGFRKELERIDAGDPYETPVEVQALRLGDVVLVGAPFEIYHGYKRRVQAAFDGPTLVLSLCGGDYGYAPERPYYSRQNNYAAAVAPYITGERPFTEGLEDDLVQAMTDLVTSARHP